MRTVTNERGPLARPLGAPPQGGIQAGGVRHELLEPLTGGTERVLPGLDQAHLEMAVAGRALSARADPFAPLLQLGVRQEDDAVTARARSVWPRPRVVAGENARLSKFAP